MKKLLAIVLIVTMTLISMNLFATGSSESQSSSGKEQITFITLDAVNFRGQLEEYVAEFNASNEKYEVVATFAPEIDQVFLAGLQSGKAADITFIYSNAVTPYLESGKLGVIPDAVLSDIKNSMFDYSFDPVTNKSGQIVGIPYNYFPSWGKIMINEDLWAEAGVNPEDAKTWDDFMQLCKKVTKFDSNGKMIQAGFSAQRDEEVYFINRVLQLGGNPYNEDGSANFNNEIGKKALQSYTEIFLKYGVDDMEFGETIDSFKRGTVAAMNGMPWFASILDKDTPDLNYRFIDCPSFEGAENKWGLFQVWCHVVNPKSVEKEGVWEFLKFICSKDNAVKWSKFSGELSSVKAAVESEEIQNDVILSPFTGDMKYGVAGIIPLYTSEDVRDAIKDMLHSVTFGYATPEEALNAGATEVTRLNNNH